jgi:FKBP-type peptidyl-prolyl cis-trans isomerase (trigger factor)
LHSSAPVVSFVDNETNIAKMTVTLSGTQTMKAFNKACDLFNEEVKTKGYKVDGFRSGAKLPPAYILKIFSSERVNAVTAQLLTDDIQDECEKTGLKFVGRGRILNFNERTFEAGNPHTIELECDLWPDITYGKQVSGTNDGYNKLKIQVVKPQIDMQKYDSVKKNILERYKELEDTPAGTEATVGDVVLVNMKVCTILLALVSCLFQFDYIMFL